MKSLLLLAIFLAPQFAAAKPLPVLTGLDALRKLGVKPLAKEEAAGVGYAQLTENQQERLSKLMHEAGKCGGYEALPGDSLLSAKSFLEGLASHVAKDRAYSLSAQAIPRMEKKPEVVAALAELKAENLQKTVDWLSAFPSRYNRLPDPNQHVIQLEAKVKELLKGFSGKVTVEQVSHSSTRQNTLKVHFEGSKRATELVVIGAHLDSINQMGGTRAPGADDDASGIANILEALRVFSLKGPAERSVEFFFYAGEESGLLGSAEIARQYKSAGRNVVAVLQLDMTMFPGSGQLVIGNVDDFTSSWLREYLVAMNETYLGARLIPDRCGYGCSDHASWYRQGYPTLFPFESDTEHENQQIHTEQDVVSSATSYTHSLVFAKIALVMAMDLGNSTAKQPY